MSYFFCKLIPPRPTFAQDMSSAERRVMEEHVGYWTGMANRRIAVVFGPVADPSGGWGAGIVEVKDEAEVRSIAADDPAMLSGLGFRYEIHPMPRAILRS